MGHLPGYPLGKQVREMYATNLAKNICDLTEYQECILLLKTLSRDELVAMLTQCLKHLSDDTLPAELQDLAEKIQEYHSKFQNIEGKLLYLILYHQYHNVSFHSLGAAIVYDLVYYFLFK